MKLLKIEKKPAFRVMGYKKTTSIVNNAHLSDIPRFWTELTAAEQKKLSQVEGATAGMMGLSSNEKDGNFDYWLAAVMKDLEVDGLEKLEIPEATYAIFEVTGPLPEALEQAWDEIFQNWLAMPNFQLSPGPQIEWAPAGDIQAIDYKSEIWLAVEKKNENKTLKPWERVVEQYQALK